MEASWSEEVNPQQRQLALQSVETWRLRAKADKVYRIVDSYLDSIGEGEIESIWLIGSRAGQHSDTKNHGGVPNENSDWDWLVVGDGFDEIEEELVRQYEDEENPNHPIFKKFEGHGLSTRGSANDIVLSSKEPVGFGIKVWPEESSESETPVSKVSEAVGRMLENGKPSKNVIAEVDWNLFSDTMRIKLSAEDACAWLNRELDRLRQPEKKREKRDLTMPAISLGNIPTEQPTRRTGVTKDTRLSQNVVEEFRRAIERRPDTIFDVGVKSAHSADENTVTINTGIPALRAILWDVDEESFYVINTCPGAGSCIKNCYAMSGYYIMNDGKNLKLINRLQMLMNYPNDYERKAFDEADDYAYSAKKHGKTLEIRWNDAGDIFSEVYFKIIVNVTNALKSRGYSVNSYAYTKVAGFVKLGEEHGITMSFSSGASTAQTSKIDKSSAKLAQVIPYELFKDLLVRSVGKSGKLTAHAAKDESGKTVFSASARETLKQRVIDRYRGMPGFETLTADTLRYTDDLPKERGNDMRYYAIVLPAGDSDAPAQRRDVKATLTMEH